MSEAIEERVEFKGDTAIATLPEGTQRQIKVSDFVQQLAPKFPDTCGAVLPDGSKAVVPIQGGMILIHQTPPQVYGFRWIANDSKADFGPGTKYRDVRLSLPYVIVLAVFANQRRGGLMLSGGNECYFSNSPLEGQKFDTPLAHPALLNCSKIACDEGDGSSWSWICTQHLETKELRGKKSVDDALSLGLGALLRHLFESGFNRSSENHEGASGFSATVDAKVDSRLASVEAWEKATDDDPLFALDVPWLPVGKTLREIVARHDGSGNDRALHNASDLVRLIVKASTPKRTRP
jgi:hypothetical protein